MRTHFALCFAIALSARLAAASTVEEIFHQERQALTRSGGVAFDFAVSGDERFHGRAAIIPATETHRARLKIETAETTIWSDGETAVVEEKGRGVIWRSDLGHAGARLLARYDHGVPDAFTSPDRFEEVLIYKPRLERGETIDGRPMGIVTVQSPSMTWRWDFDAETHLLRRQIVRGAHSVTIDYTNLKVLGPSETSARMLAEPSSAGLASRTFTVGGPQPGDRFAPWTASLAGGAAFHSSTLAGRIVVLDFWATWCGPCRPALRDLERFHRAHPHVAMMGLRWMDSADAAAFARKYGITYPVADSPQAAKIFAVAEYGIPLIYVIGRDGRVVDYAAGYDGAPTEHWLEATVARASGTKVKRAEP